MHIDVPFYKNPGKMCGPAALKMVLAYFGREASLGELSNRACSESNGATQTIGLAKAAAELGFGVEFYGVDTGGGIFDLDYYKDNIDDIESIGDKTERLIVEAIREGVKIYERHILISDILAELDVDCIPIVLVNWNVIDNKEGYKGHFLPIIGYEDPYVFFHNSGPTHCEENQRIHQDLLDEARLSNGTEEEVILIRRPKEGV